jgi:hypothetical protein
MLGMLIASSASANQAPSDRPVWQRVQLAISLDFVTALGWAYIWLACFLLLAGLAMAEFVRFSGGFHFQLRRKPEPLAEGLEAVASETGEARPLRWRDRRGCALCCPCRSPWLSTSQTGLRSSLSSPHSTFHYPRSVSAPSSGRAIVRHCSASFWLALTATVWPVRALNDEAIETLDICYRTSANKDAFNWSYIVLPVVGLTALWLTVWFPYRLWTTIERSVPRPDAFTELGEPRRDLNVEYERLLERDESSLCVRFRSHCHLKLIGGPAPSCTTATAGDGRASRRSSASIYACFEVS